ncbi:MAG: endonuclease NucS domain-containing protein [Paracoccaceae bacterium]
MRDNYRAWLEGQGYADNTCNAQMSRVQRIEAVYGPIEDIVAAGGYDRLFEELSYSTVDERHNRPNPSKFKIDGNLRNNLASYKDALARYARFLTVDPATIGGVIRPAQQVREPAVAVAVADPETASLEKQRLSLERDMQASLRLDISGLEPGLTIIDDGAERAVLSGFIDILARDRDGKTVVIELKAGKTDARVIGQVLGYMGDMTVEEDAPVRGIIVAHDFDARTRSAARAVPNLSLVRYAVSFRFTPEV